MPSYNFLFWNINMTDLAKETKSLPQKKTNVIAVINEIVRKKKINFVLLAETQRFDTSQLLKSLNTFDSFKDRNADRIKRFVALDNLTEDHFLFQETNSTKRITSFLYEFNDSPFLLNLVHFGDKFYNKESTLSRKAREHADEIKQLEKKNLTTNTIVVGDFNLDPYDPGLIEEDAFNATMSKTVIEAYKKGKKKKKKKPFFFNPSWDLLGKRNDEDILGTFFHHSSQNDLVYWHVLDQVLIREDFHSKYKDGSLEIIYDLPGHTIANNGKPNRSSYSDHLPIVFTLTF